MFENTLFIQQVPYLGLFILLILGTLGFPFPEDAILILTGFLVANQTIRPMPAFLVIYSGLLVTDFMLFSFGKGYGRKLIEHKRFRRITSPERLLKIEEKLKKWGILVIFLGRHLLIMRGQIFLAAGAMRMPSGKFILADALSSLITITLWGGLGYAGGSSIQKLKEDITKIEHIILAALMIFIVSVVLFKYFKGRRNSVRTFFFTKPH